MKFLQFIILFIFSLQIGAQTSWSAPETAHKLKNPFPHQPEIVQQGKKIFQSLCSSCHGENGKGNPVMVKSLNPPPTDLTSNDVQKQPDGAIFWKISNGRGLMAAYQNMLSEKERWAVVHYIRELKSKINEKHISNTENDKQKTTLEKVNAFPFNQLINVKTTAIQQNKGFGFGIQHRFGATKFDEGFIQNFLGLDLAANVRFSFEFTLNDKLMLEIGRTRYGKFYDLGGKYLIFKQTADNSMPVSIALYENIAITTEKAPTYSSNATFDDGTAFTYKFAHRLYYDNQIIISRKFSQRLSGQITGQFVWRNLTPYQVPHKEKAYVFAVPLALRYKLGYKSAIDFEIIPNTHHRTMPISMAYEIASSGNHVFQITITNSERILSQNLLFNPTIRYPKDGFMIGFNLVRYF